MPTPPPCLETIAQQQSISTSSQGLNPSDCQSNIIQCMCRCYSLFQITALVEEQFISFLPANCGDPTVPTNGSIGTFKNTSAGTKIVFGCNPGFVPAGNVTAVCASDGSWTPNPATLVCKCKSTYSHLQQRKLGGRRGIKTTMYVHSCAIWEYGMSKQKKQKQTSNLTLCLLCFGPFGISVHGLQMFTILLPVLKLCRHLWTTAMCPKF